MATRQNKQQRTHKDLRILNFVTVAGCSFNPLRRTLKSAESAPWLKSKQGVAQSKQRPSPHTTHKSPTFVSPIGSVSITLANPLFSTSIGSLSSLLVLHLLEPGLDFAKLVVEYYMGNDTYVSFNGPEEIQGLLGPMGQADGFGFRKRLF